MGVNITFLRAWASIGWNSKINVIVGTGYKKDMRGYMAKIKRLALNTGKNVPAPGIRAG